MRKINPKLLDRMIHGDLLPLLNHIKSDKDLRLEVRQGGKAFVYYRKGKALEIGVHKFFVDEKYVHKTNFNIPDTQLAINKPAEYFSRMKVIIDNYVDNIKKRFEFDTQQKTAIRNHEKEDKYIIIDMEYAFEQNHIAKSDQEKRAVFDLLGIDKETNKIIFFEVKKGMGATKGKSGIDDHINDFLIYVFGKNKDTFKKNLIIDIKNIIEDKTKLGILNDFTFSEKIENQEPELVFVFHPDNDSQVQAFSNELNNRYKFFVVNENNYKLK